MRDFAPRLSHEAIVLYFFLAAVADKDGLSFYHDATIAGRLRISEESLARAGRTGPRRPGGLPHAVDAGALLAAITDPTARWRTDPTRPTVPHTGRFRASASFQERTMKVSLWAEIRRLYEIEKLSQRAIVKRLHCGDKTVESAADGVAALVDDRAAAAADSILKPYHPQIDALIAKYPDLSAVRVLEEISRGPEGFRGSVYPVRRYLYQIRPDRGRVYQEVIYEPGEAMQVDWGDCGKLEIGQTTRRVSVFVAVLCYSRLCYIEFTLSQHKAEFYRALVNALNFFGGSPKKSFSTTCGPP